MLGDSIRTANVSTTKASTLLILDLADFRTLMAHHPELARAIDAEANGASATFSAGASCIARRHRASLNLA